MADSQPRVATVLTVVRQTAQLMVDELVRRLRAVGYDDITGAHEAVLENIDRGGTRLTVLAARSGMTHQSMGELVRVLETGGYVERRDDPSDGRARIIRLTKKGRDLVRRATAEIAEIEAAWNQQLNEAGYDIDIKALLHAAVWPRDAAHAAGVLRPARGRPRRNHHSSSYA